MRSETSFEVDVSLRSIDAVLSNRVTDRRRLVNVQSRRNNRIQRESSACATRSVAAAAVAVDDDDDDDNDAFTATSKSSDTKAETPRAPAPLNVYFPATMHSAIYCSFQQLQQQQPVSMVTRKKPRLVSAVFAPARHCSATGTSFTAVRLLHCVGVRTSKRLAPSHVR